MSLIEYGWVSYWSASPARILEALFEDAEMRRLPAINEATGLWLGSGQNS